LSAISPPSATASATASSALVTTSPGATGIPCARSTARPYALLMPAKATTADTLSSTFIVSRRLCRPMPTNSAA
jgi:hypothetical protein